ncbi:glutamate racemase [Arachidicoccus rhizosphaerae]|jgi:glutamate racemase|uniref:Glutamate racemase n=1 Tax=Arachidicoccus rhizosphaerae TaxID=551991 RepID=A0A1H3ZKC8_9BACT|nr:glutamate racemase [Arachidicoccus rhizosphaerae]SEA24120.1 glutamate racemase [Arachidicoccus rhizosphaerae]
MQTSCPIGIFDSGYGGLTILSQIRAVLPDYDYIYLGDNARAPYGSRSFETIYEYTLEAVKWFFKQGCPLVILACNTASAKALRTIQQNDLPGLAPDNRVLGIVRPTSEVIGHMSEAGNIGILATQGTVESGSYILEIQKFFPTVKVQQQACPIWVPLVEYGEQDSPGTDYFIKKYIDLLLKKDDKIDSVLLACTHYPLLEKKIKEYMPVDIRVISQGKIVAASLADYLKRHPEIEQRITQGQSVSFYTTEKAETFNHHAKRFFGAELSATQVHKL